MEKVSRWMDDDLAGNECAGLVRACAQGENRESWLSYHLIGEALRGDLTDDSDLGCSSALTTRICAALAAEPNVLVPGVARAGRESALASADLDENRLDSAPQVLQPAAQSGGHWLRVGNGALAWKPWLMAASVAAVAVVGWQSASTYLRSGDRAGAALTAAAPVAPSSVSSPVNNAANIASMDRYFQAHSEVAPVSRFSGQRAFIQPVSTHITH